MGSCFSGPVPPSRRRHHSRSSKEPRRAPVVYEYYATVQNNEHVLIRRRVVQSRGHERGGPSRAADGSSRRSGRRGDNARYGLVLREEKVIEKKKSNAKGKGKSKASRDKEKQKSRQSRHDRRRSSYDSEGGDEGLDEDAQNQLGFWVDETTGDQAGSRGHELMDGHDDVSSLHEHDAVDDPQVLPELVRR